MKERKQTVPYLLPMLLMLILLGPPAAGAETTQNQKAPHRIPAVTGSVKVDGQLDEEIWREALVLELKFEVEPGNNIAPPVKTEVLLAYNTKYLYAAFRAYDPRPGEIRAHVTDRDHIANDDYVRLVLDTYNDSRSSFVFDCNPFGIQGDHIKGMIVQQEEFDAIWDSAGKITDWGYVVEMSIPFTTLRFQKISSDQVWGIDAARNYPRNLNHTIGLFPRDRSNNCYMCQAEKVIGFQGAKPGANIEFDPTLTGVLSHERENFPDGKMIKTTNKIEPGLTFRWSFTPNLTLNATAKPDFSHVEADMAQLDVNTQFILFYPEKRPFFLEGFNIFRTMFYAYYSRSIIAPNWGIKLTGKEGRHSIGFFSVQDSVTNLVFGDSESYQATSLDMNNIGSVARYSYDVGRSSTLGILITDREGKNYYNRLAGIDGNLRFTKKDSLVFQYLRSQTRYPDEVAAQFNQPDGKFDGSAFAFLYRHSTEHILIHAQFQDVSPFFRADLGFADQTNMRVYDVGSTFIWRRNPGHWFTTFNVGGGYYQMDDQNQNYLMKNIHGWLNYWGPLQSYLQIHLDTGKRTYLGREYDDNHVRFDSSIQPSGALQLQLSGDIGDRIDYTNAQPGRRVRLNPSIQYKLGRRLQINLNQIYERLKVDDGELYTAMLTYLRLVYQFNSRVFIRANLQYADYRYNPELYSIPQDKKFKHLYSQILFSYKINPQTVLFIGYTDDYYGFSFIPLTQSNRTLFLKIGYALVL